LKIFHRKPETPESAEIAQPEKAKADVETT